MSENISVDAMDSRFGSAVKDFEFVVPPDFNHDTQLDTFSERVKKLSTNRYFSDSLNSENFRNATIRLMPGKTYRVRIFLILERVTSEECITFLRKQEAILVGGQGLTVLADQKANEFLVGKWTISLDEKEALWEDVCGKRRVPDVGCHSDGGRLFCLASFDQDWHGDYCLLCFSEK